MRVGIIGHFGGGNVFLDGQTIKTKEVNDYIENYYGIKTYKFDTYKILKNPFKLIYKLISVLKNSDIVIVILAIRGYKVITPLLMFFNIFYKRRLFDIIIGGGRYRIYKNNNLITRCSRKYEKIFVETNFVKNKYLDLNINNVDILYNFKNLKKGKFKPTGDVIKVCIFSRIIKEKGIKESINSIIKANSILNKFELDIYGVISDNYKDEFENIINNCPDYIKYKGTIDYDKSVDVLNNYDVMLFLTYYKNESFAGTILDAFFSGVPIIASDWNSNFEILKDGVTGIKINNIYDVVECLIDLYNNKEKLNKMKKNCLNESLKYLPDRVMKNFIDIVGGK